MFTNYALMKGLADMCLGVFAARFGEYLAGEKTAPAALRRWERRALSL